MCAEHTHAQEQIEPNRMRPGIWAPGISLLRLGCPWAPVSISQRISKFVQSGSGVVLTSIIATGVCSTTAVRLHMLPSLGVAAIADLVEPRDRQLDLIWPSSPQWGLATPLFVTWFQPVLLVVGIALTVLLIVGIALTVLLRYHWSCRTGRIPQGLFTTMVTTRR